MAQRRHISTLNVSRRKGRRAPVSHDHGSSEVHVNDYLDRTTWKATGPAQTIAYSVCQLRPTVSSCSARTKHGLEADGGHPRIVGTTLTL